MTMKDNKGSVLIPALIMLAVLSLIGASIATTVQIDITIARNDMFAKQAFYHAEAGLNIAAVEARRILREHLGYYGNWDTLDTSFTITNSDYGMTDILFTAVITPLRDSGGNVVLWGDIDNDAVSEINFSRGFPIIKVVSTGSGPTNAEAVVEAELRMDVLFQDMPAPLYGTYGVDQGGSGSAASLKADGEYKAHASYCPNVDMPDDGVKDIVTYDPAPGMTAEAICTGSKHICQNGADAYSDTGPAYPVSQTIDNLKASAIDLSNNPDLTAEVKDGENWLKGSGIVLGSASNPGVFYANANLDINNLELHGILLIEGKFIMGGNFDISGVIMVKGSSVISGTGSAALYGAFLGEGLVEINGGGEFYYDCEVMQSLLDSYERYHMMYWIHK